LKYFGLAGESCTISSSNVPQIPPGSIVISAISPLIVVIAIVASRTKKKGGELSLAAHF